MPCLIFENCVESPNDRLDLDILTNISYRFLDSKITDIVQYPANLNLA